MPIRDAQPVTWRPRGASDTLESSESFKGAMASLSNLVPDPSTLGLFQCRPAAISLTTFSTFTTPGFISAFKVIGNIAYGMIATGRNAGHDEPFAYDLATKAFHTVTGTITSTTTPASPLTTGAWTPPTMDVIGTLLVVTHPGFNGTGGNYFGWFDISTPTAPVWHAGNLGGAVQFTVAPVAVKQFNGRAYYLTNSSQPAAVFSDALNATNVTNANQVLTFGDNVPLTALGALPLNNQLGGIIQSLLVFKGVSNIYQVTGDPTTSNLAINALNCATGTLAPNTICSTTKGLMFMSPEGLRLVDFNAHVSDPIGQDGKGISLPFIFAVTPSRMAAACNDHTVRISTQNGTIGGSPNQEWWFDISRNIWTGPHTFTASLIQPWNNTFIEAPVSVTNSLWQSDDVQSSTSTFSENGTSLTYTFQTALLPDTETMNNYALKTSVLWMAVDSTVAAPTAFLLDQNGSVLDSATLPATTPGTVWGAFQWGGAPWGGAVNSLTPQNLDWSRPIVFTRIAAKITGFSAQNIKIGAFQFEYQRLRYTIRQSAAA